MESRYLNRFKTAPQTTAEQIKNIDHAGNLTEIITHARGSLDAQHKNVRDLMSTSVELLAGIDTHQQLMKVEMVKNLPRPTSDVMSSVGKQLGYVQLTSRFLQAGLLHFMEETYNAHERIKSLEKTIAELAKYDDSLDVIGSMVALDIDTLEADSVKQAVKPVDSVTSSPTRESKTPVQKTADKNVKKTK